MPKGRNVKSAAIPLQMDWENARIEVPQTIWRLIAELLGLPQEAADAMVEDRRPPAPADPHPDPRRHAARSVHQMVPGHCRQRQRSLGPCRGLITSQGPACSPW